jgi:hypothetical protein
VTGKQFEKVVRKIVQSHKYERHSFSSIKFGFCTCHFTERSTNNMTSNFSNNMAAAAAEVAMDIEEAFDTIRH